METIFRDCTFLMVKKIPNKTKGKLKNGTGNTYNKCTFLIEEGMPAILFIIPNKKWYNRLLNNFKNRI